MNPPKLRKLKMKPKSKFELQEKSTGLSDYEVKFSLDSNSLPEGKEWNAGNEYDMMVRVKMVSKRSEENRPEQYEFKVTHVKPK